MGWVGLTGLDWLLGMYRNARSRPRTDGCNGNESRVRDRLNAKQIGRARAKRTAAQTDRCEKESCGEKEEMTHTANNFLFAARGQAVEVPIGMTSCHVRLVLLVRVMTSCREQPPPKHITIVSRAVVCMLSFFLHPRVWASERKRVGRGQRRATNSRNKAVKVL